MQIFVRKAKKHFNGKKENKVMCSFNVQLKLNLLNVSRRLSSNVED